MEIDFLGVGWSLPIRLKKNGQIAVARYEESVRQSIWMILSTAKGERVMRPDFGCDIHEKVFAPNSLGTVGQIVSDVQDALIEWEPRIDVLDVDTIADPQQPNVILIQINYQIRTTNNIFNLVYPFYLQ
ncbi:GPW/gp25 family protein [Nostoc sp. TCL26-01]|uniref:GPW/gp25 family protein n=1 Tax=Nostoc sp. TCL26-01 TaxID=2576904 RepID=UPI0015BE27C5|nr:GPW/gp25 family protein [Nostoc sp. TCL26-01]QLE58025.1 GPW/gp25 family protein [Nostoc sp. TCL26-01]